MFARGNRLPGRGFPPSGSLHPRSVGPPRFLDRKNDRLAKITPRHFRQLFHASSRAPIAQFRSRKGASVLASAWKRALQAKPREEEFRPPLRRRRIGRVLPL